MNLEQLKQLQAVQLEMMDDVHALCVKHNIRYYLIAGSAIGAVRHGGIIPWDIDIDIAMPRLDYNKFIEKYSNELSSRYCVRYYKNTRNLNCPHALILLKNSTVRYINNYETYGIYIDLFPLDAAPDSLKDRNSQEKELLRIKNLLDYKYYRKGKNSFVNIVRKIISFLLFPVTRDYINRKRDRIMTKFQDKEEKVECWCSMASKYKYSKQCMPQSIYGKPTLIDFEGRKYYGPERIKEHLAHLYKNYLEMPSQEVQEREMNLMCYASWIDGNGEKHEIISD